MGKLLAKLGLSAGASLTVVETAQLDSLWNALITLAISLISVLTIEGISWLKAWLQKRKAKEESEAEEIKKSQDKKED